MGNKYAVFLSYSREDEEEVRRIALHLADEAKLKPWFDEWSLIPGESWINRLARGLEASASCAAFVGRTGSGTWSEKEIERALRKQVEGDDFPVIPVLLPTAKDEPELPGFLSDNTWVDFRNTDWDEALWRLECGITRTEPGRGRPAPVEQGPSEPETAPSVAQIAVEPAKTPQKVFIAYRHQEPDAALAHVLEDALKKAGHEVFIDTSIRWGTDWVKRIRRALENADYLLLLLSRSAALSELVVEEVAIAKQVAAKNQGRPCILPVRLAYTFSEPLPYHLSTYLRTIHQESWAGDEDTDRLVRRLAETIGSENTWHNESPDGQTGGAFHSNTPSPFFDPRDLVIPGGALDVDSRFYIPRRQDEVVLRAVHTERACITIKGPRQNGKTSMIMRVFTAVRDVESQLQAGFIDLQALPDNDLETLDAIWAAVARNLAEQLELPAPNAADAAAQGHLAFFTNFLETVVFAAREVPLLICIDEVDRLFSMPTNRSFFSSARSLYNRGAYDATWKNVRWMLGTAADPANFIKNLSESPFNVGLRVDLLPFTRDEVALYAERHGMQPSDDELDRLIQYTGGRPNLVHLMLYHAANGDATFDELYDGASAGGGVFRDHLHHYLVRFDAYPELAKCMKRVLKGDSCSNSSTEDALTAAGLVCRDANGVLAPACGLYNGFFQKTLRRRFLGIG